MSDEFKDAPPILQAVQLLHNNIVSGTEARIKKFCKDNNMELSEEDHRMVSGVTEIASQIVLTAVMSTQDARVHGASLGETAAETEQRIGIVNAAMKCTQSIEKDFGTTISGPDMSFLHTWAEMVSVAYMGLVRNITKKYFH
jgi:hypothetical protein